MKASERGKRRSAETAHELMMRAQTSLKRGDLAGAEREYRNVLARDPRHFDALHLLGVVNARQGRAEAAAAWISKALAVKLDHAEAHNNLGNVCDMLGRHEQAVECFNKAIALAPSLAQAHNNLGNTYLALSRVEDAIASFRNAVALAPDLFQAHNNLGRALLDQGLAADALASVQRALHYRPDHADAHCNMGNTLCVLNRLDEAVASYRKALLYNADHAAAHNGLGTAFHAQNRYKEAVSSYQHAIALQANYAEAYNNLGNTLIALGRLDEAQVCSGKALALKPGLADAEYNQSLALLFSHRFETAWPLYERRAQTRAVRHAMRKSESAVTQFESLPRWRGPVEELGQKVAIWAEQGIGDEILNSTLIPELIASGTPFVYEVDARLMAAYRRAFPETRFVARSNPPDAALMQAQRVCWAGSLPGLFRQSSGAFARQPKKLLTALTEPTAEYRSRLQAAGAGLRVAVSWRSERNDGLGTRKSAPLEQLAPLFTLQNVAWVDVQYGDTAGERAALQRSMGVQLLHIDDIDYYNDLESLLALLDACDLLITTSNVNAHLAGALGKPAWLLCLENRPPFFYWVPGDDGRSLWYPSVEIVSAPHFTKWGEVAAYAAKKLSGLTT